MRRRKTKDPSTPCKED